MYNKTVQRLQILKKATPDKHLAKTLGHYFVFLKMKDTHMEANLGSYFLYIT